MACRQIKQCVHSTRLDGGQDVGKLPMRQLLINLAPRGHQCPHYILGQPETGQGGD